MEIKSMMNITSQDTIVNAFIIALKSNNVREIPISALMSYCTAIQRELYIAGEDAVLSASRNGFINFVAKNHKYFYAENECVKLRHSVHITSLLNDYNSATKSEYFSQPAVTQLLRSL